MQALASACNGTEGPFNQRMETAGQSLFQLVASLSPIVLNLNRAVVLRHTVLAFRGQQINKNMLFNQAGLLCS